MKNAMIIITMASINVQIFVSFHATAYLINIRSSLANPPYQFFVAAVLPLSLRFGPTKDLVLGRQDAPVTENLRVRQEVSAETARLTLAKSAMMET